MSWSERFQLTFSVFKKTALPLYLWYLILLLVFIILAVIVFLLPPARMLLEYFEGIENNNFNPSNTGFTPMAFNPEYPFDIFESPIFFEYLPAFLFIIFLFSILGFVAMSMFYTGTYHVALKGLQGKARFRDFKFSGFSRILGFYLILFLGYLPIFLLGFGLFMVLSTVSETASAVYAFFALAVFVVGTLFILPWMFSAAYYIIAHAEQNFTQAFKNSWKFFRNNMGALWGGVVALFLLNIGIGIVEEISSTLGSLLSFLATPLLSLIPIIWTLTLMRERENFLLPYPSSAFYPDACHDWAEKEQTGYPEETYYQTKEFASSASPSPEKTFAPGGYSEPWTRDAHTDVDYHDKTPSSADDSELNFCSTCGSKIRPNAIYCSKCGVKIR